MIQSTIVKCWNETENDNVSVSGPISDNSRLYETPLGEITKGGDWNVDKINSSWLVPVESDMFEIILFAFFYNGTIYPINTVFSDDSKLEMLSYILNTEERHTVKKVVVECTNKLGYMMEFGGSE
ncbi:hypothetical protein [Spartinivicinus poritis]|uniref:Uncharacterized protein n=1 Tax=Spartinivicinus poritis TaxID=2994640 RepID=A0ABT5UAY9_9GAMM|nr:hypothetical protein [Spartinivicinus sp. A2-2]MDE1463549.1 hypothetical protein [Spartinivicinus sp. A2-2]